MPSSPVLRVLPAAVPFICVVSAALLSSYYESDHYSSPKKQLESGVAPEDIQCRDYKVLVIRDNGVPTCVMEAAAKKMKGYMIATEEQPKTRPVNSNATIQCNSMLVRSPDGDMGCVYEGTAKRLEFRNWESLGNYTIRPEMLDELRDSSRPALQPLPNSPDITLSISDLPVVGKSADVTATVTFPNTTSIADAHFLFVLTNTLNVSSSDSKISKIAPKQGFPGYHRLKISPVIPGYTYQFNMTVIPTKEDKVEIRVDDYSDHSSRYIGSDAIYLSIGSQRSDYQLDSDSHVRDPRIDYVWTQRPHPQCWSPPWFKTDQTVQDYYSDLGITVLDSFFLDYPSDPCAACGCLGGSMLFLTPRSDYNKIPAIGTIDYEGHYFPEEMAANLQYRYISER